MSELHGDEESKEDCHSAYPVGKMGTPKITDFGLVKVLETEGRRVRLAWRADQSVAVQQDEQQGPSE